METSIVLTILAFVALAGARLGLLGGCTELQFANSDHKRRAAGLYALGIGGLIVLLVLSLLDWLPGG
jgi:hypothetical protein